MANPAAKPSAPRAPAAAPPASAAVPPIEKKKFSALYIIIPLVVVVLVGVGVAWEMFRADMEARQQGQGGEEKLGIIGGPSGMRQERKSRELKPKEESVVARPASDEDDLTGLGKKKKPPPPRTYPPAEKAWRAVKADFERLEARNETTAKKYRMKYLTLEDRKASVPEAAFVKEAGVLEEQLKAELAKPENQ